MMTLDHERSKLLLGCAVTALSVSLAAAPGTARAQAFQATETVTTGSATRIFTGTGTETVRVDTQTAVIEWTPDEDGAGNALDFLPAFNVATFENGPNNADFAVLNIVNPSANGNVTVFNGTVISRLIDLGTGAASPGGTVAFYSPSGIFVGGSAVFDVGNLILTTSAPLQSSFDDFVLNGGQLIFLGAEEPLASIIISPGAQITATPENSYLAVVSAEIQMFGTTSINGSQAYIGGDAVNITVSNGLFDIEIPIGSTSATPIVMDGDVGGPSSTGATNDNHLIYAVAAAQSDPIALLFSGNLGFEPAASAGIVNGEIIISANYEVSGRDVNGGNVALSFRNFDANAELTDVSGTIVADNFDASSTLLAVANDEVRILASSGNSSVEGNLYTYARNLTQLGAFNGNSFSVTEDVALRARAYGNRGALDDPAETDAFGGTAIIEVDSGGAMTIGGSAITFAGVDTGFDSNTGISGTGVGGNAIIQVQDGTLDIGGIARADAEARGVDGGSTGITVSGTVTGGTALIRAGAGGNLTIGGNTFLNAFASGNDGDVNGTARGGNARGGSVTILAENGGTIDLANRVSMSTNATGGVSNDVNSGTNGDGGRTSIQVLGDGSRIDIGDRVIASATASGGLNLGGIGGRGRGGVSQSLVEGGGILTVAGNLQHFSTGTGGRGIGGGDGFGGVSAAIIGSEGQIDVAQLLFLSSVGSGGFATEGFGGNGGRGEGGGVSVQAIGGANGNAALNVGGDVSLVASGAGGQGGLGDGANISAGIGGEGVGGTGLTNQADQNFDSGIYVQAGTDNGFITIGGDILADANGRGGAGGTGGLGQTGGDGADGTGGIVEIGVGPAANTADVRNGLLTANSIVAQTNGTGGNGGAGGSTADPMGDGGDGFGSLSAVFVSIGNVAIANQIELSSSGEGGVGDTGGRGIGGGAEINGGGGQGSVTGGSIRIEARGTGGAGTIAGGNAFGGGAQIRYGNDFSVGATGALVINAAATGGSASEGVGGDAEGGFAEAILRNDGNSLSVGGLLDLFATAQGGQSNSSSPGANALGGEAILRLDSDAVNVTVGDDISLTANGFAGDNVGTGAGGEGIGGLAEVSLRRDSVLSVAGDVILRASGRGGRGVGGGEGFGGIASISVDEGLLDTGGVLDLLASGEGGDSSGGAVAGGDGGRGNGGRAAVQAFGGANALGRIEAQGAFVIADAIGGDGGDGDGANVLAGRGGNASGGSEFDANAFDSRELNGAYLVADPDGGSLVFTNASIIGANATAGSGGNGGAGQAGGDGGDAFGGSAFAGVDLVNNNPTIGNGAASFGNLDIRSNGIGGEGGFGDTGQNSGDGGNGTGGRTNLLARFGEVRASNVGILSQGTGGAGHVGGNGTGGSLANAETANGGSIVAGAITLSAGGNAGRGRGDAAGSGAGGFAQVDFSDGSIVLSGGLLATANGRGNLSDAGLGGAGRGGTVEVTDNAGGAGTLDVTGVISIAADGVGFEGADGQNAGSGLGGDANLGINNGSTVTAGGILMTADGTGGIGINARGGDGFGGNSILELTGSSLTTNNIVVSAEAEAGQGDTGGDGNGGAAQLFATDSTISASGLSLVANARAITQLSTQPSGVASAGVAEAQIRGSSLIDLSNNLLLLSEARAGASGASFGGLSALTVETVGTGTGITADTIGIDASAVGGDTVAAGRFFIDVQSGDISTRNLDAAARGVIANTSFNESTVIADGGNVLVSGSANFETLDDFIVRTGQGGIIGGPDINNPTALVLVDTAGTLSIFGDDDNLISFGGAALTLISRDIEINSGARIGATDVELLSNNFDNPALLGGASGPVNSDPAFGYVLSQEEASRIEGATFRFEQGRLTSAGPNSPDIVIADITASGSLDDGPGLIDIVASGTGSIIRIEGTVNYVDVGSTDVLRFTADNRIEAVTPGGIRILDTDGLPQASLFLDADNVWIGDASLIGQLQDNSGFAGRDDLLRAAASGSSDPRGFVRAGTVGITFNQSLLVRNTGSQAEPAGILVGDGGLTLDGSGATGALDVFAYGARIDDSGTITSGEAFFNEVNFNLGSITYTDASEFNDCVINTGTCGGGGSTGGGGTGGGGTGGGGTDGGGTGGGGTGGGGTGGGGTGGGGTGGGGTGGGGTGGGGTGGGGTGGGGTGGGGTGGGTGGGDTGGEGSGGGSDDPGDEIVDAIAVNNPQVIEAPITTVPPLVTTEPETNGEFGIDFPGLLEEPEEETEGDIDDPVASGGDSSLYSTGASGTVEVGDN